jgi:hypothetical protein
MFYFGRLAIGVGIKVSFIDFLIFLLENKYSYLFSSRFYFVSLRPVGLLPQVIHYLFLEIMEWVQEIGQDSPISQEQHNRYLDFANNLQRTLVRLLIISKSLHSK